MDSSLEFVNEQKIERTIKALKKNNINGYFVKDKEELIEQIEKIVKENSVISVGGSMTLFETGVMDHLDSGRYKVLDRYKQGLSREEIKEVFRKAFSAEAYFTSANAITEDGEIYNVDGYGNRVAAITFGPDKVIIISGVNKIVKNHKEAVRRVENIAAPANVKRLNLKPPCSVSGTCMDCSSESRVCCEYSTIKRQPDPERMHVIFLNENYGY